VMMSRYTFTVSVFTSIGTVLRLGDALGGGPRNRARRGRVGDDRDRTAFERKRGSPR
jgi:hypothetical protein